MSTPNKPHQKDAPWMDDKYLPPSREKTISNDREHSDRYRRWSPSRRNASSSRPKSDWKYDQNRERYQKRPYWSYHPKPYWYGERRWYDDSYKPNAGPHPSERAPKERADSQQRDVQPSASSSSANVTVSKSPGSKPSIVIKKVKKVTKPTPGPCGPPAKEDFTMNQFLAEHLTNTLFNMPQTSEPMMHTHNALINKIIADEAIKMLSSAASSNEPSSLNEPCDKPASATPLATGSSNETTPAPVGNDTVKPATSATATADSALLQKSAEQVTRKLINQLTTMSKYNLKQMIDNPAGKYETALNKHAQNKLRAEVRKQLKNFNLADAVRAKDSSFGSDVMAPDEAIDAEKIPAELLEQIGKALDIDFYDLSGSEPRDSIEGNAECSIVDEPSANKANNEGASAIQQAEQQTMKNGNNGAELAPNADPLYQLVTASVGVEAEPQSLPAEPTPPAKTVSFLRVSTVDELNKRIETTAEDIAAISAIPQPTLIASDMLGTSGAMAIPEIGSTLTEPTVSLSLVSGPPRNASNAPLDCPPIVATTENFSLPSVQSSSALNPTQIEPSVAVGSKGPAQQLTSLPGKTPNKGKQKPSPPLNGKCGSQENNSPAPGKKKNKSPKKNPKQNPNQSPPVKNGTTAASAKTINKQPKPAKKSDRRAPPLMPFPPTGSVSICETYSWPNDKPSDGADTSAPNDHGNRSSGDPAKQPSPKGTSKVTRWGRENVVRSAAIGATNGECNLRTKTPEPVPISSRSPQADAMRNGNGKRGWRSYPLSSKINEQRTKDGNAGKNSTSWNSPKRRRDQQQEPPEVPTAGNVVEESESKEAPVQPENEAKQDNGSEIGTANEKEQGTGTDIRISNVRSLLVDATPPTESVNSLMDESNVSSMEHTANATTVNTNEHVTDQVVLNGGMQLVPGHANGLGVDNITLTQPDLAQAMGEMIVPDVMSAPRPHLVTILDQMQSLDTQTMELFKRKMEIDAEIMKLNGERMEIDQAIVKLQNARDEQMNTLRFALFLPFSSADGVQNNCPPIPVSLNSHGGEQSQDSLIGRPNVGNGQVVGNNVISSTLGSDAPQNTQPQQTASNHQERTIRRITKISELLRFFKRRRLLSERSSDENPPADDSGSIHNDLPMMS